MGTRQTIDRPAPLMTAGAIHFLEQLLRRDHMGVHAHILEFGGGASTIWYADRAVRLVTIEHHPAWVDRIRMKLKERNPVADWKVIERPRPYHTACLGFDERFDLISVDGRDRVKCVATAMGLLNPGGVMIVDNMERVEKYSEISCLLEDWPRVDATAPRGPDAYGFTGPVGWVTSWWIKPGAQDVV